ncbi:hypothetical protein GEMRC1_001193 [Eukaryota sp. GEM-RC1]
MSLPDNHALVDLEKRIRFISPKLTSLTPDSVARFLQEVCHFSHAQEEEIPAQAIEDPDDEEDDEEEFVSAEEHEDEHNEDEPTLPSYLEDPKPPLNFHKYILPKIMSLISMVDSSAMKSQASL